MTAAVHIHHTPRPAPPRTIPSRIIAGRAALALAWAAAVAIAIGDRVPTTASALPTAAAVLVASYPLIDVIASLLASTFVDARAQRVNAAVSGLAVAGITAAAFGSDAGATLIAFGTWAAVSGAIQVRMAVHHRRHHGRQLPMILSGGLSTVAGLSFIAAAGDDQAHLASLAGYMAFGALLLLVWARRGAADPGAVGAR